jgi:hypothetical protein
MQGVLTERLPVATGYNGINIHDFRDNNRLGIEVTAELEVFPWKRVLRQTLTADTKFRTLRGGVCYYGLSTVKNQKSTDLRNTISTVAL